MTRDTETIVDFYRNVIGWGRTNWDGGDTPYMMFTRTEQDSTPVAGSIFMEEPNFPPELPSHLMGYIETDDIERDTHKAKELGGTIIHGPADIPNVGRFTEVQDPLGARFTLFQSQNEEEHRTPGVGDFNWHELATSDYEKAFAFYSELFGWKVHHDMDIGDGGIYRIFGPKDSQSAVGGMFSISPSAQFPPGWLYYINVSDMNTALEAVKSNGGTVVEGPLHVPDGNSIARCTDPEGTRFALHAPPSTPSEQ